MAYEPSLTIANEFIDRAQKERRALTHMQLQKLVYLAHGWNLAINGEPLIEDDVEAWEFGPVIRKLYDALRRYGGEPIRRMISWGDDTPFPDDNFKEPARTALANNERAVVDRVWDTYKSFQAFQLSALTHSRGSPWQDTYEHGRNRVIETNKIWDYFADLANRPAEEEAAGARPSG